MNLSKSYDYFKPEAQLGRIHIIGCGSIGSTVAENLARCGLTKITLWDFDVVEAKNLANQMFLHRDINSPKVEAVGQMLKEINPDIVDDLKLKPEGWTGEQLSGFVFLCVDSIELRREIVEKHFNNLNVKAMFDFRTRLEDAQHYAADWSDFSMKESFINSMQFSHEEALEGTPVSACNVTLSVCPTIRLIVGLGVANFMNFWNKKPLKKLVLMDGFQFTLDAF